MPERARPVRPERLLIHFAVSGNPQPQGSKKHVGGGRMIESAKGLKAWRRDVRDAATLAMTDRHWLDGPLRLGVVFFVRRPRSHYRTGRFAGELRADAPRFCTKKPDADKLIRAIGDALTGIVYEDDSQIACIAAFQFYGDPPGAIITVDELKEDEKVAGA